MMVFIPFILASVLSLQALAQTTSGAISTSPPSTITATPSILPEPTGSPLPLTDYTFTYPNLPEQVYPFHSGRGPQSGYNVCNSTTEGPESECQTMFVNTLADFCLWGSPTSGGLIGNVEAIVVAYCSQPGHGTRVMPPGTITAAQFIKTPGYIQVTGLLNQTGVGLDLTDAGGELDPHGADLAGNPLGGLVFSNNLPSSTNNSTYTQANNWSNFMGGGQFCIKLCDPKVTSPDYCQNIFDTEGCFFNMPAAYTPNQFTSCEGDNQLPPGNSPAVIPATSSCTTYSSSQLYPNSATTSATSAKVTGGSSTSGSSSTAKATSTSSAASTLARSGAGFFAVAAAIVGMML